MYGNIETDRSGIFQIVLLLVSPWILQLSCTLDPVKCRIHGFVATWQKYLDAKIYLRAKSRICCPFGILLKLEFCPFGIFFLRDLANQWPHICTNLQRWSRGRKARGQGRGPRTQTQVFSKKKKKS